MTITGRFLIAFLLIAVGHTGAPQPMTGGVRESGVLFPAQLAPPLGETPHHLTGTATRERTLLRVNVYAYGLYIDADAARQHLKEFGGQSADALDRNPSFIRRLLEARLPMTLRLVATRELPGEAMRQAFDDELGPRVSRASGTAKADADAFSRFRGFFDMPTVASGTEFLFSCTPDGALHTVIGGGTRPVLTSPVMCRALFDIYLGDRPLSGPGRRRLLAGVPAILGPAK